MIYTTSGIISMDWLLVFASFLFLFPLIVQFRIYQFIEARSYLRFSLLFGFIFIDTILTAIEIDSLAIDIFATVTFISIHVILSLIALDVIDNKFPLKEKGWMLFGTVIFVGTVILKYLIYNEQLPEYYTSLRIAYGQILALSTGLILLYAFANINMTMKNNRTRLIRRIWLLCGLIITVDGILSLFTNLSSFISIYLYNMEWQLISQVSAFVVALIRVNTVLIALIVMTSALLYPEALLLSMYQIYNASILYKLLEENEKLSSKEFNYPKDIVLDYLDSIPKDLLRKN